MKNICMYCKKEYTDPDMTRMIEHASYEGDRFCYREDNRKEPLLFCSTLCEYEYETKLEEIETKKLLREGLSKCSARDHEKIYDILNMP